MQSFDTHFEILPESQKWVWSMLSPTKILGFVLYGEIALALRLGHRQAVDFVFFSEKQIDADLLQSAIPILKDASRSKIRRETPQSLTVEIYSPSQEIVKISFFGTIKFGRLRDPQMTDDQNLLVASPEDIFSLKLKTLLQRASYKDYKDIAELLRAGFQLKDGLEGAMAIFGNMFSPAIAIRALNYFKDVSPSLSQEDQDLLKSATKILLENEAELKAAPKLLGCLSLPPSNQLITTQADKDLAKFFSKRVGFEGVD